MNAVSFAVADSTPNHSVMSMSSYGSVLMTV